MWLDHPADPAQSGAVGDVPSVDHGFDGTFPQRTAVLVEVVAPVGVQTPRLAARAPLSSSNRRDRVERGQELGDVVSVAAGERDDEWGAMAVDDQVVLGAGTGAVDGRGPNVVPSLRAQTCDPSTERLPRSSRSARRSSGRRAARRRGQTSASVHSRSRYARQPRRNNSRPPPGRPARRHGPQHEQDTGECCSVRNTQPPGMPVASFGSGRQQRGHPLPQVVRNKISTHPDAFPTKIVEC